MRSGDFVMRANVHLTMRGYGTRKLYGARKLIPPALGRVFFQQVTLQRSYEEKSTWRVGLNAEDYAISNEVTAQNYRANRQRHRNHAMTRTLITQFQTKLPRKITGPTDKDIVTMQ
jgi:hypothetical protein